MLSGQDSSRCYNNRVSVRAAIRNCNLLPAVIHPLASSGQAPCWMIIVRKAKLDNGKAREKMTSRLPARFIVRLYYHEASVRNSSLQSFVCGPCFFCKRKWSRQVKELGYRLLKNNWGLDDAIHRFNRADLSQTGHQANMRRLAR